MKYNFPYLPGLGTFESKVDVKQISGNYNLTLNWLRVSETFENHFLGLPVKDREGKIHQKWTWLLSKVKSNPILLFLRGLFHLP